MRSEGGLRASFNNIFGRKSENGDSLRTVSEDAHDRGNGLRTPPISPTASQRMSGSNGFLDYASNNGNGYSNGYSDKLSSSSSSSSSSASSSASASASPSVAAATARASTRSSIEALLGLPDIDKKTLALQRKVVFMQKPRGECIVRKGDPVKCVYVMLSGLVMVFRSGNNYADYSIGPGDCFGEECFGDAVSVKTYRAANDVQYCEVDRETFVKSDLFAAFRVRMDSDSKSKRGSSVPVSPSSVYTNTDMDRERASEAGTGIASVFFAAPLVNMCNIGPFASPSAAGGNHADMYDAGVGPQSDLERTPSTKKEAESAIPWCFFPQFLSWT